MDSQSHTAQQQVILVSHTHWDRAWYLPFQEFRIALVRVIDRLLTLLQEDADYRCFLLDGQTVVLEDYLEVRPEKREELAELVQAGRLQIGPWYVQPDEFLVSPEALIRNLQLGRQVGASFGPLMLEGYVPDSFGHISQLPQIFQGFGILSAFFWRGMPGEKELFKSDFWWQAPDGSKVSAHWLVNGYFNALNLGYDGYWGDPSHLSFSMPAALQALAEAVAALRPSARTSVSLLMNGTDHIPAQREIPAIIEQANQRIADIHVTQGTLTDYHKLALSGSEAWPTYRGELRAGRYAPLLQGVYSSRVYLKQANARAQTLLERYTEPLTALASCMTGTDERALLTLAWKTLLKNHPHDDICGCSVDAVHEQMMTRFAEVTQIGTALARTSGRVLAGSIAPGALGEMPLMLFNPLNWSRSEMLQCTLDLAPDDPCVRDFPLWMSLVKQCPFKFLLKRSFYAQR